MAMPITVGDKMSKYMNRILKSGFYSSETDIRGSARLTGWRLEWRTSTSGEGVVASYPDQMTRIV